MFIKPLKICQNTRKWFGKDKEEGTPLKQNFFCRTQKIL